MIAIRTALSEEVQSFTSDPVVWHSPEKYVMEKDGVQVALFGVFRVSLVGSEGWPWVRILRRDLLTLREIARYSKAAMKLWGKKYGVLRAVAEEGLHEGWFRFLGLNIDSIKKPVYAGGKTMVFMEYRDGDGSTTRIPR